MRKIFISALLSVSASLTAVSAQDGDLEMDRFIDNLMSRMTIEEKAGQTSLVTWDRSLVTGDTQSKGVAKKIADGHIGGVFNVSSLEERKKIQRLAVEGTRLGIPLIFGLDVIHGFRTTFPIPLALSCSWDMDLIERTARAAADEASSEGIDWTYSPMVDIVRDPRWGRTAESAGEDPYLGSRVAEAMVHGYQGSNLADAGSIMACVKHFALYGAAEGGRDYDAVDMSLMKMYQTYLPPYKAAVDAGAGSVMTSFNDINGIPATANRWLLTDLLRGEWGFDGFTVSDYTSVGELSAHGLGDLRQVSSRALKAGLDMDMVSEGVAGNLDSLLEKGYVTEEDIDRACRRILEAKYRLGLFRDPYLRLSGKPVESGKYRTLALEAARKSIVLLKNEGGVLPLERDAKIALVGPLANARYDLLGTWAGPGRAEEAVTVKEGMSRYTDALEYVLGAPVTDNSDLAAVIQYDIGGCGDQDSLIREAVAAACRADVVVAVLGETGKMSGESASMTHIGLQHTQKRLLEALVATGKDVVLVLLNGRPMTLEWEDAHCTAIVDAWAPGLQGGNAVADVLFGEYNPSGRLSMTFPRNEGQIPLHYDMKTTGRPYIPFRKYRTGYIDCVMDPLYPFGYGLSYSKVEYSALEADVLSLDEIRVSVDVTNTGDMEVEETVQLYVGDPEASVTRPVKELKSFKKISLRPGQSRKVEFLLDRESLKFWNDALEYIWEPGKFVIEAGPDSRNTLKTEICVLESPGGQETGIGFFGGTPSSGGILVEAESFARKGGWAVDQQFMDRMGSPYLLAHGMGVPVDDASTYIDVPRDGVWHVYVRTYNWTAPWTSDPGPGAFKVRVGEKVFNAELGTSGGKWEWQYAGKARLKAGRTTLALDDMTGFDGRCDAVYLTTDERDVPPDSGNALKAFRRTKLGLPEPDRQSFDLVVVGGGIAGMCAAVAAARLGCKVALVHDRPVLGGNNSSEVRVHLGGYSEIGPNEGLGRMLREFGHTRSGNARPAEYYEDWKKQAFIESEGNVTLFSNYRAVAVRMDGNRIASVLIKNVESSEEHWLEAPLFSDCTGDGGIGYMAGAHWRMGRESRAEFGESLAPENADSMTMGASVQWYSVEKDSCTSFPEFSYGVEFNEDNCEKVTMGEWKWETGMALDQINDAERIRDYGLMVIYSNWSFLKNRKTGNDRWRNRDLGWVAYVSGKRESRRLVGDYILKQDDIDKNVFHEDASFTTTWAIDLHFPDTDNSRKFPGAEFKAATVHNWIYPYAVPYRCLYSRNIENLFMAGRNISVTHVALGTVRVMRTTGMMGEVVGMAASICRKYGCTPREVYWNHLDELKPLMKEGVGNHEGSVESQRFNLPNRLLEKPKAFINM